MAEALELTGEEAQEQRETVFPEKHRFSILVPLYNTPPDFLKEMIQSVLDQTYPEWELCLADGSDEAHPEVGAYCLEMSRQDSRIVYRKLEETGASPKTPTPASIWRPAITWRSSTMTTCCIPPRCMKS